MMPTPSSDETSAAKADDLCDYAGRVPASAARAVREAAQKQLDSDLRAQDALLTRGNQLLALAGVAISLLVGLTKESAVDTWVEKTFLVGSLVAVMAAAALGVSALRVRDKGGKTDDDANIFGIDVPAVTNERTETHWINDHDLLLAQQYCVIRHHLGVTHDRRARLVARAQLVYLLFLVLVSGFGATIVF